MKYNVDHIKEIVKTTPELKSIDPEKVVEDNILPNIGFDSLEVAALLFELEQRHSIEIEDDEIVDFKTIGDLLKRMNRA